MSLPRYPEYKPTDAEWLTEVPKHWTIAPLKQLGRFKGGAGFPHELQGIEGEELPFFKVGDLAGADVHGVLQRGGHSVSCETAESLGAFQFPTGAIVFAKVGAALLLGRIRKLGSPACIDNNMMGFMPTGQDGAGFIAYAMSLVRFDLLANPGAVPSLNEGQIGSFAIPVPPNEEQIRIVSFLDRETAKIDALVAEQERLIALLKEKRQAVISHAVTKGLNPDAPMKDSGIEWLGEVPEHWLVAPLALRYTVQLGKMLDSRKVVGENLRSYLRVFDVQWGAINTDNLPQMDFDDDDVERYRLLPGDLLVNEGGSYPGRAAIWQGQIAECFYQKALHRVRVKDHLDDSTRFVYYVFSWAATSGVFLAGGNETTIEHLPAEKLRRYRFAFPPLLEQLKIAEVLEDLRKV